MVYFLIEQVLIMIIQYSLLSDATSYAMVCFFFVLFASLQSLAAVLDILKQAILLPVCLAGMRSV